ncbi:MAG: phosphatase PAP2/dual specificity phosphatase family protein [Hyphomicrobiales bacterium]
MSAIAPGVTAAMAQARSVSRASLWLACLGTLFYLTYGTANWLASLRAQVPEVVFDWERQVPFLGWTILPYWSTNAFYAASLFVCATRQELDTHGRRLLTAQIVAVLCFIAFPLRFSWPKPETSGVFGFLFEALGAFDKPFNQAPSLHVALTVILWSLYRRHLPRSVLPFFHAWSVLVLVSVMTTFQHHFVDIPTGALLGLLCVWAWPDEGSSPLAHLRMTQAADRRRLATSYGLATAIIAGATLGGVAIGHAGPMWLWALWPAFALTMVALAYFAIGPALFQKRADGAMSLSARLLLAPYRLGAFLNSRFWTRHDAAPAPVIDDVWLGRFPTSRDLRRGGFLGVVDLTAEFMAPAFSGNWRALPMLDLVAASPTELASSADAIERARSAGPVLVCCALGYGRSVAAVAAWLLRSGRAASVTKAIESLREARPRLVLSPAQLAAIEKAAREP